jgi:2-oxo-3-hexenedioate decarboxylase/2-keto-4-pentenoate hydratase
MGYAIQRRVVAALSDAIGGWKIGAGGPDETPLYAPIPAQAIHASGVTLPISEFPGALEIYRSRFHDPNAASQPENLADCLANAGLVVGDPGSPTASPADPVWDIDLVVDGETREGRGLRHPVGDPRRLVVWLANHLAGRGDMLRAGQVVTTGALVLGPLGRDNRGEWRGIGAVSVRFG